MTCPIFDHYGWTIMPSLRQEASYLNGPDGSYIDRSRNLFSSIGIPYATMHVVTKSQKKILVVDDNDDCRALLSLCIKRFGYEVFEAATALEAINRVAVVHPDLIMMDLSLPGMSGEEATTCLKANPATREIPVLISTAFIAGNQINRALEAGASEILHKPLDLLKLRDVLSKYLPVEDARIS
jgi:CheY-like chemotaxis protein